MSWGSMPAEYPDDGPQLHQGAPPPAAAALRLAQPTGQPEAAAAREGAAGGEGAQPHQVSLPLLSQLMGGTPRLHVPGAAAAVVPAAAAGREAAGMAGWSGGQRLAARPAAMPDSTGRAAAAGRMALMQGLHQQVAVSRQEVPVGEAWGGAAHWCFHLSFLLWDAAASAHATL